MAPTVKDMLLASGMTETEIAALDQRVVTGVTTILSTAAQSEDAARRDREAAELAQRAQREQYDQKIAPALDAWGNEKVQLEAEKAYYRTQAEAAKAAGFIAKDAPGYTPPAGPNAGRTTDGRFVAGASAVPGSPAFMTHQEGLRAVNNATWVITEHMRLHGGPPPDDIETLLEESTRQHMPFRDYAAKKYNFDGRKAEMVAAREKERDEKIRAEASAERDKFWAERAGNNPAVRPGAPSEFTNLRKGVDAKQLKDPLSMNKSERHAYTSSLINKDIAENTSAVN